MVSIALIIMVTLFGSQTPSLESRHHFRRVSWYKTYGGREFTVLVWYEKEARIAGR